MALGVVTKVGQNRSDLAAHFMWLKFGLLSSMSHPSNVGGRVANPTGRAISTHLPALSAAEPDFLESFEIVGLSEQLNEVSELSPFTVLVILEIQPLSSPLLCHCRGCQERQSLYPDREPESPRGIHVLFGDLSRRSRLWLWVRRQIKGRTHRVVLCNHQQGYLLWQKYRQALPPGGRGPERPAVHLW